MAQSKLRSRWTGRGVYLRGGFATGAAADTNIAMTGIRIGDEVVFAAEVVPPTGAGATLKTNLTAEIKITAANVIQCDTTNTTGNQVLILWLHNEKA